MKNRFDAHPWTYLEGRDPKVLCRFNGFGNSLFVVRHGGTVNPEYKQLFQDVITNDPGLKTFKTYYNLGTGDVFYLGSIESGNMRFWDKQISNLQQKMDQEINTDQIVIKLKGKTKSALLNMYNKSSESENNRIKLLEKYKAACEKYEAYKQQLRTESPRYKEIQQLQSKISHTKRVIHQKAIRFETSYKVNLDPQFAANQKMLKKGPKQLEKSWKQTASNWAHGKCREKVIRSMGRLGKAYVPVGEACSTMIDPVCLTLHSPGTNSLHSCPKCRNTSVRDESGRAIGLLAFVHASYALGKLQKSDHLNGQTFATKVTALRP